MPENLAEVWAPEHPRSSISDQDMESQTCQGSRVETRPEDENFRLFFLATVKMHNPKSSHV